MCSLLVTPIKRKKPVKTNLLKAVPSPPLSSTRKYLLSEHRPKGSRILPPSPRTPVKTPFFKHPTYPYPPPPPRLPVNTRFQNTGLKEAVSFHPPPEHLWRSPFKTFDRVRLYPYPLPPAPANTRLQTTGLKEAASFHPPPNISEGPF